MAWPLIAAALAMQAYDKKQKQDEMRKQARAEPYQRLAAEMGAPTYEVDAIRRRDKIEDEEGDDYLEGILAVMQQQQQRGSR